MTLNVWVVAYFKVVFCNFPRGSNEVRDRNYNEKLYMHTVIRIHYLENCCIRLECLRKITNILSYGNR
jgi:hypothetical protein